jgi:hypothetical protein
VTIQIFAEGAADVCERHIVDRRPGHARLDPFDIGEIVEAGLKHSVRGNRVVESCRRRERRPGAAGERGRDTAGQLGRKASQLTDCLQRRRC